MVVSEGAYVVENVPGSSRFRSLKKEGVHSAVVVPVRVEEAVLGTITLGSRKPREFPVSGIHLLEALGHQMGIALQKAQLYQEIVESKKKLETALTLKDRFLSVISHELRTPLNVVLGYTAMMKDGMLGEINSRQAEVLQKIMDRANQQLEMIDNVLHATVLETRKRGMESLELNPADLLDQLKSEYDTRLLPKGLALRWNYPEDLPILRIDRDKLRMILQNLIGNAIKFTSKGEVTVSAEVSEDGQVSFKVTDTCVGISKEHLQLIFDQFYQADNSHTRRYSGVGMGLYIARKFIEQWGGTVDVQSERGKGSVFTVRFDFEK